MSTTAAPTMSEFDDLTERTAEARRYADVVREYFLKEFSAHSYVFMILWYYPRLVRSDREAMEQLAIMKARISRISLDTENQKAMARAVASDLGDIAKQMFANSDELRNAIEGERESWLRWDYWLFRYLFGFRVRRIELLACTAEDIAETLALGASDSFIELVDKELHAEA